MKKWPLDELKKRIKEADRADNDATALVLLRELVARTDARGYYRYLLAETLRAIGNPAEAKPHYAKVSSVPDKQRYLISLGLAQLHADTFEPAEAERHFKSALKTAPKFTDPLVCYANFLAGSGRVKDAIEVLLPARKYEGDQAEVNTLLGNYYRALGDFRKAIACYEQALSVSATGYNTGKSLKDLREAISLMDSPAETGNE